jgi:hypothetical protein
MESAIAILLIVLNAVIVGTGIYLRAYLNKKAENLASKEDFKDLKTQTAELRQTTKEIESKIDDQVWNRQRQWELKRDVLFEMSKRLAQADDALLYLDMAARNADKEGDPFWMENLTKRQNGWTKAIGALDEARFTVGVVSEKETIDAVDALAGLMVKMASGVTNKDFSAYSDNKLELSKKIYAARWAIRKSLGIDAPFT